MKRLPVAALLPLLLAVLLAGCGGGSVGGMVRKTLQATGLQEAPPPQPVTVPVNLFAGSNLNAGNDKRPGAVILKIYHLRSVQRFEQAPYSAFLDSAGEQAALGADLLSSSEVVLLPGARHRLDETMSDGSGVLGLVALFRAPAEGRWRLAFDTGNAAAREGITVGVHACAMTTDNAALITRRSGEDPNRLGSVRCAVQGR
ncbi:type VI secretion system lipoprotein TssJ [Stenotrophomonas sp. MMGLT7]|uniref:type VI secretion system lipoprotein TssJ n=1 Tax=Stenotrophomonas sp. MMGLT7 TaxID=2901227 RepID=UPI001E3132D7|nr:type VI secretion system lipoprotein TssJ [Stenotrophomonas sp. MMGLT7]MCD7099857.1 type VI secretion system lipoprotein TssJ [Stenotrophomonas sp. MMGLT7]